MAETKGRKIYAVTSNCEIIGVWSNLSNLVTYFNQKDIALVYFKVYRQLKKHTERGQPIENFTYDFTDDNGKTYQIKIEILQ